jgi:hypothetical protein
MIVDPFRLAIALVPVAAYVLLLGLMNLRRRPFLTTGGSDVAALGLAISGLLFVGPIELFRPDAATAELGNYIWLFLLLFYWLCLLLLVLLSRPRLVIYNIGSDEIHSVLAESASRLDPDARWAGNSLTMPRLGVHLHLESFDLMRNVTLASSGSQQSLEGWRRLARELSTALKSTCVKANPRAVGLLLAALVLLAVSVAHMLSHPVELAQGMNQVLSY